MCESRVENNPRKQTISENCKNAKILPGLLFESFLVWPIIEEPYFIIDGVSRSVIL